MFSQNHGNSVCCRIPYKAGRGKCVSSEQDIDLSIVGSHVGFHESKHLPNPFGDTIFAKVIFICKI